ncbi:chemotaxis protein CheB [Actinophytocola sp.]|uniref:chemotaxis protein CheB n=1 Tax=Actinophytocola sp. TaxID=1872138 RepID=UPI003899DB79
MSVRVLAVGASAGGQEALERLVAALPAELGACVLVTVHITPTARSRLPEILTRAGSLPAAHARDGQPLRPDTIVVAPPDRHLVVDGGRAWLSPGPKVNRHRPSVDVMFASTARWAGPDMAAVVLSGSLDDGAVGAAVVARAGGAVYVQDPAEAQFVGMPRAALAAVPDATVVPTTRMAALLTTAVRSTPAPPRRAADAGREGDGPVNMADSSNPLYLSSDEARLTRLVCPDCHGSLAQVDLPTITYYRCHVGHQWSPQTLAAAQAEVSEEKLWSAVAALDEQAALRRHLATHGGGPAEESPAVEEDSADHLRAADRAGYLAHTLRRLLDPPVTHHGGQGADTDPDVIDPVS